MSEAEAIHLAGQTAHELNIPWSYEHVSARRRRLWPFPPFWIVEARIAMQDVTAVARLRVH